MHLPKQNYPYLIRMKKITDNFHFETPKCGDIEFILLVRKLQSMSTGTEICSHIQIMYVQSGSAACCKITICSSKHFVETTPI